MVVAIDTKGDNELQQKSQDSNSKEAQSNNAALVVGPVRLAHRPELAASAAELARGLLLLEFLVAGLNVFKWGVSTFLWIFFL